MRIVWFVLVVVVGVNISEGKTLEEEYCWRDYKGEIPSDAFPAGRDERGEITYIGQALHPGGHLIPGTIRRGSAKVYYEWKVAQQSEEHVRIFCCQHPEQYKWIHVQKGNSIFNLNGTQYITGGHDGYGQYCIARKNTGSELAVGKANLAGTQFDRMWYSTGHAWRSELTEFEVLVFDPNAVIEKRSCASKLVHINFYG